MSYTLRGRLESRLAAAVPVLILALAVHRWWALELVAVMLALGALLDVGVYHRLLPYQPAWVALPLGLLELALVYLTARWWTIHAPLWWALALFGLAWLLAQLKRINPAHCLARVIRGSDTVSPGFPLAIPDDPNCIPDQVIPA